MIERAKNTQVFQGLETQPRKILRMRENDRTAGSIPSWEKPSTPTAQIEANIAAAQNPAAQGPDALAFQQNAAPAADDEFGFADLIDMINPLQHIPLVSHIYREITGDSIKPASQILGGAVFGGALGAAGGLVNVVIEEETGGDITQNALAYAKTGKTPQFKNIPMAEEEPRTASYAPKPLPEAVTASWTDPSKLTENRDFSAALLAYSTKSSATSKPEKTNISAASSFTLNV